MNTATPRRAFTLIELVSALAIMLIMLMLTNQIFRATSDAVAKGASLSDAMNSGRSIEDQLNRDFAAMLGPDSTTNPGMLVILNRRYTYSNGNNNLGRIDPKTRAVVNSDVNTGTAVTVRSDQLLFFRSADDMKALVPGDTDTFTPDANLNAGHARIWYGHLKRTNENGEATGNALATNGHRVATYWSLGRQVLFMHDPATAFADGANATQVNHLIHSTGVTGDVATDYPFTPRLNLGLADVVTRTLDGTNSSAASDILINIEGNTPNANDSSSNPYYLYDAMAHADYQAAVDDLLFGSSDGLQFNPAPRYDFDNGYSMKSWQIAQQHPLLARNVSDFVVQFAADADNDGVIDRDSDGDGAPDNSATAPDPIVWYDIDNPLVAGFNYDNGDWGGSGNSTVPGYTAYTPQDTTVDLDGDTGSSNDETLYVWRHDDDTVVDAGGDDIIDSSEATNSKWPFLIRLRWRVHDEKGALDHSTRIQDTGDADGDGSTTDYIWVRDDGVWFEQIVRVPRPMP